MYTKIPEPSSRVQNTAPFAGPAVRSLRAVSAGEMGLIGSRAALAAAFMPRLMPHAEWPLVRLSIPQARRCRLWSAPCLT